MNIFNKPSESDLRAATWQYKKQIKKRFFILSEFPQNLIKNYCYHGTLVSIFLFFYLWKILKNCWTDQNRCWSKSLWNIPEKTSQKYSQKFSIFQVKITIFLKVLLKYFKFKLPKICVLFQSLFDAGQNGTSRWPLDRRTIDSHIFQLRCKDFIEFEDRLSFFSRRNTPAFFSKKERIWRKFFIWKIVFFKRILIKNVVLLWKCFN